MCLVKKLVKQILKFFKSPPFILALITALAYGILAPLLGFYWDDLPIGWIRYKLGQDALARYFSTNRPAWGIWYGFLTKIFPFQPIYWQIIALFWRWLTAFLFWEIFTRLLPQRKSFALPAAAFFLLYPGFNQQAVSFVYGYHFTVYSLFLFSVLAMLAALEKPRLAKPLTLLGLIASALNFLMGEYFFTLDLIRPFLLWMVFRQIPDSRLRRRRVFSAWLPYLIIFGLAALGRIFVFNNQVYGYSLLDDLRTAPLPALWNLTKSISLSLWITLVSAWGQAFIPPDFELQGKVTVSIYLSVILVSFGLIFYSLVIRVSRASALPRQKEQELKPFRQRESFFLISLGFFSAILAGIPFWITGLPVSLGFPANRATLPFIFGSVLILTGILLLIPQKKIQIFLVALLIAFSAGRQFLWTDEYRRDWRVQKNFFWQISWRIPALEEDTLLLLNEGAFKFYADNSLSAPLNWIYAPNATTEHIPYMLFYPRTRFGTEGEKLAKNTLLSHDFIAGEFKGSTNQMLLINYAPPGCLHIVDPKLDSVNKFIDDKLLRNAASFSRPELILPAGEPQMPALYAPEPNHGWCYFYEKAELARQRGDWEKAVQLGAKAFAGGDHPNDPTENFVFIEAYAHTNAWENAEQLSLRANRVSPSYLSPMLCRLWARIDADLPQNSEKAEAVSRMKSEFRCE